MKNTFITKAMRLSVVQMFIFTGSVAIVYLLLGCRHPAVSTKVDPLEIPLIAPLTSAEVLAKFRARASAVNVQSFERLVVTNDPNSQTKAMEMVLFTLTGDELSRIGVTQTCVNGGYYWVLARSTELSDGGKAFVKALGPTIKVGGVTEFGMFEWTVPREQFFEARYLLLRANLSTNEIRIIEPRFKLR